MGAPKKNVKNALSSEQVYKSVGKKLYSMIKSHCETGLNRLDVFPGSGTSAEFGIIRKVFQGRNDLD